MFQLGKERYALEAGRVVEVAPLLALKRLPQAPKGVAGIFNYRGRPEPGLKIDAAPYLGPVLIDSRGAIQWLDTQRLLSESTRSLLFSDLPEPAVQAQGSTDVSAA